MTEMREEHRAVPKMSCDQHGLLRKVAFLTDAPPKLHIVRKHFHSDSLWLHLQTFSADRHQAFLLQLAAPCRSQADP